MKKSNIVIIALGVLIAAAIFVCGESVVLDSSAVDVIADISGITSDEDYVTYTAFVENDQLDEEGKYAYDFDQSVEVEEVVIDGSVHVSFAENSNLEISYYTDEAMTQQINVNGCYLNPGDSIYVGEVKSLNTYSNLYQLAGFRICAYDTNDNLTLLDYQEVSDSGLVYTIPEGYTGTELSIIPVGEYPDRVLQMLVYYVDDEGNQVTLTNAGSWSVNDEQVKGNSTQISAIESYTLRFDIDTDEYFYVSASPTPFTQDPNSAGYVEFWEASATEATVEYSVELHQYLSLKIQLEAQGTVTLNDGTAEKVKKGKTWSCSTLKYGDQIVIETTGECTILSGDYVHVEAAKDSTSGGYRYTLTMTETLYDNTGSQLSCISVNHSLTVTLSATGKYGTCTYTLDGEAVSGTITMTEDQVLKATYTITEDGYKFSRTSSNIVSSLIEYLTSNTQKTEIIPVTIELDNQKITPDDYFTVVSSK